MHNSAIAVTQIIDLDGCSMGSIFRAKSADASSTIIYTDR